MYSPAAQDMPPTSRAHGVVRAAIVIAAVLLAFCAGFASMAWLDAQGGPQQQAGGTLDVANAEPDEGEDKFATRSPIWQAPDLVGLIGTSTDQALERIGHGAAIETRADAGDGTTRLSVPLAAYRAKDRPGAPTAYLWVDADGVVVRAGYASSAWGCGFSNALTFREAIDDAHIVEALLGQAGIQVEPGTVRAPQDASAYSAYRADGATLERENASFHGTGTHDGRKVAWRASVDYDYRAANASGNLVDTRRVVSVSTDGPAR